MENLKIRVNSEAESKEAQELFFKLGYKWFSGGNQVQLLKQSCSSSFGYLVAWSSGCFTDVIQCGCGNEDAKKITLPELRDLVVLKRNDESDASRVNESTTEYYRVINGIWYVLLGEWEPSTRSESWIMNNTKPIEKPMKEYLRKNNDGEYILEVANEREAQEPHAKHWIEVPSGMNIYWKEDGDYWFTTQVMGYRGAKIIWQRHTLPEELPFIDDEPSLNDQYAEIEKVRQSHRTASETSNPTIRETLNQRQEQYGSFKDVAMITEQMVDVMRKGYYENLAHNQKMALYMICSKMARIVNGNPNHKDSWHDIAGYATLIDNELVSEKDMPF